MKCKGVTRGSEFGKGTSGMHQGGLRVAGQLRNLVNTTPSAHREKTRTGVEEGIDAEIYTNSELNDGEPVKTACDPLILPRYCVNPQGEDNMSEKCN